MTAAFTDHRLEGFTQIRSEGRIAPDPIPPRAALLPGHHEHRHSDHRCHDDGPRLERELREFHIANLGEHVMHRAAPKYEDRVLAQHRIDARGMRLGGRFDAAQEGGARRILQEEFRGTEARHQQCAALHAGRRGVEPRVRGGRHVDPPVRKPPHGMRPLEPEAAARSATAHLQGIRDEGIRAGCRHAAAEARCRWFRGS